MADLGCRFPLKLSEPCHLCREFCQFSAGGVLSVWLLDLLFLKRQGEERSHCRGRVDAVQKASFGGFVVITGYSNCNGSAICAGYCFSLSRALSRGSPTSSLTDPPCMAMQLFPGCNPWLLVIAMVAKVMARSPLLGKTDSSRNVVLNLLFQGSRRKDSHYFYGLAGYRCLPTCVGSESASRLCCKGDNY